MSGESGDDLPCESSPPGSFAGGAQGREKGQGAQTQGDQDNANLRAFSLGASPDRAGDDAGASSARARTGILVVALTADLHARDSAVDLCAQLADEGETVGLLSAPRAPVSPSVSPPVAAGETGEKARSSHDPACDPALLHTGFPCWEWALPRDVSAVLPGKKTGLLGGLQGFVRDVRNLCVLLWALRCRRAGVVVWRAEGPLRAFHPFAVRCLHLAHRRVVWQFLGDGALSAAPPRLAKRLCRRVDHLVFTAAQDAIQAEGLLPSRELSLSIVPPAVPEAGDLVPGERTRVAPYEKGRADAETERSGGIAWRNFLQTGQLLEGRRLPERDTRVGIFLVASLFLVISAGGLAASGMRGTNILENPAIIGAIALPLGVIFMFGVSLEMKIISYVIGLVFSDLLHRLLFPLPMQYVPPALLGAAFLHLMLQPPRPQLKLEHTRYVHALIVLLAGWIVAASFNPNVETRVEAVRNARVLLEPMLVYVCFVGVLRNSEKVRFFLKWVLGTLALSQLWGLKVAFFGYFFFEEEYLGYTGQRIVVAESRNIGTMPDPQSWSMVSAALGIVCFILLLERHSARWRWFLLPLLPIAGMNVVSSGQRMAVIAVAAAVPVVLFTELGSRVTRVRALASVGIVIAVALTVWHWIPDEGDSRRGLGMQNPIQAARQKLSSLKHPEDDHAVEERVESSSDTIDAVIHNPVGGGMGVLNIAGFDASVGAGLNSVDLSLETARGRNRISVQPGDYLYINWMAETGMPGLILLCMLFLSVTGWCLWAYIMVRKPLHRVLTLSGFAWSVALILNSITNGAFYAFGTSTTFYMFLAFAVCLPAIERDELGTPLPTPRRIGDVLADLRFRRAR